MMKKIFITLMLPALAMMTSLANANFIQFDEGAAVQPGTISYDGVGGGLVGSGIDFNLASDETATGLSCVGCFLNFVTGANVTEGPSVWTFGSGGSFVLNGTIMDGLVNLFSGDIVTGAFTGTPAVVGSAPTLLFAGAGGAAVAQPLLDFYSIPGSGFSFANTELGLGTCSDTGGGGFVCGLQNADLAVRSAVPTPATGLLFGIGAAGLIASRKKFQA